MRRLAPLLAVLVLVGCSSERAAAPRPATTHDTAATKPVHSAKPRIVHVLVFDGDLGKPVRRARVRIGPRHAWSNRGGLARLRPRQRRVPVTISARGYESRTVRINFIRHPKAGVRIYRRDLQWPMYGVDAARSQAQLSIRLRPPFRVVWSRGLGGLLEFPAVVDQGVAFVANSWGRVRALSMANGATVWRHDIPHGKMASSPAVVGDEVVAHGMDGHVWLFDRRNGRLRWSYRVGSPIESSPIVSRGIDYFGSWNGDVYALDLRGRRLRWIYHGGAKITSSVARAGRTIYVGDYAGRLLALDARNGRVRFSSSVNGRIYGTPAVAAGRVFVPSSDGNSLTAFSTGGRQLWRIGTGGYVYSSPAVWAGRVYFGSYTGVFYCVSARTGAVLWSFSSGGSISGAPAVVGRTVYFSNFRHRIYALDAQTGRRVGGFPDGEYVPVSGNGGRLLLHGYSRLYAVAERRR